MRQGRGKRKSGLPGGVSALYIYIVLFLLFFLFVYIIHSVVSQEMPS